MVRFHDLSLRQLEYVVAVADTLGFRRAAERCHVSQPALSAQVLALEEALGVQVFERDHRHVALTPAGGEIVAAARRVLAAAVDLCAAAQKLGDPFTGALRVGVIPTIAPYLLPEVGPALQRRFPDLRLLFREDRTRVLVAALQAGELDAALLALEADLGDLTHTVIASDPFLLAAPRSSPLARRRVVRAEDLEGAPLLLLDEEHCLRHQALSFCAATRVAEAPFRATSLGTLAQMVASGAGVTILPALAVPIENRRAQMAIRPFAAPSPSRTVVLAWRPTSPIAAALRAFAAAIAEAWPGEER
jgi:LysR family transcriptional regulator, hydrogen peroxide-inducible genes activator